MWILKHNCHHSHAICNAAFKETKKVCADIVFLQESCVSGGMLAHEAYEIRWGTVGERKEKRVAIEIAITTRNRIMVEGRVDIINHPYNPALDMWKLEEKGGKKKRRRRVVKVYDNYLRANQAWTMSGSNTRIRALVNAD